MTSTIPSSTPSGARPVRSGSGQREPRPRPRDSGPPPGATSGLLSSATDRGRDDDAEHENDGGDEDGERDVLVLLYVLPDRERRDLGDKRKGKPEYGDAEERVGERCQERSSEVRKVNGRGHIDGLAPFLGRR